MTQFEMTTSTELSGSGMSPLTCTMRRKRDTNVEFLKGEIEALRRMLHTLQASLGHVSEPGLEPTRVYDVDDAREFLAGQNIDVDAIAQQVDGKIMSAFVRAVKPRGN